jgi:hypothetical protein
MTGTSLSPVHRGVTYDSPDEEGHSGSGKRVCTWLLKLRQVLLSCILEDKSDAPECLKA